MGVDVWEWGSGRARTVLPRLAFLVAVVVLFGGCVRAEIGVRVEDDGSGTATVLFAFKESMLEFMSSLDEGESEDFDPKAVFSDVDMSLLPGGTKVDPYERDGFVGSRITMPFKDVKELSDLLGFVTSGASVPTESTEEGAFELFALERTEDGWRLDATAAPLSTEEDLAASDEAFTKQFLEDASFTIKVRLPGKITQHNADKVDGNELTWSLDFESIEARELRAVSSGPDSGGGLPWVLIGGGLVGVVALGAIGWDVRRRRLGTRAAA